MTVPAGGPAGSSAAWRSEEDIAELVRAVEALKIDMGKDNTNKKDKKVQRSRGGSRRSSPDRCMTPIRSASCIHVGDENG